MIRVTLWLILVACLAGLAAVLANIQGDAQIIIAGYQLATPIGVLLGVGVVTVLLVGGLILAVQFLLNLPQRLRAARHRKRQEQGEQALAKALMALARGDGAAARQATQLARHKLPQKSLPRLMAAQAAILQGLPDEAEREYQHMMSDKATPEQRALGLEGLYYSARRRGDDVAAGAHAAQVLQLAPNSLWALDGLTALAVKHGDWPAVENWMRRWARAGVKRDVVRSRRAVVYMAQAQAQLIDDTQPARAAALRLAEKAVAQKSGLVPAIALAARLSAAAGNLPKARRILAQAWSRQPHAELAQAWLDCYADQPSSKRMRAVSYLTGKNSAHEESHILRARVALAGQRWSLAQTLLEKLREPYEETAQVPRRLCLLLAQSEAGVGDKAAAQLWQDRASRAPLEAGWMAAGLRLENWQAICPVTGDLGTVAWGDARSTSPALAVGTMRPTISLPDNH